MKGREMIKRTLAILTLLALGCGASPVDSIIEQKESAVTAWPGAAPSLASFDYNAWMTITTPPQFAASINGLTGRAKWRLANPSSLSQGGTWTLMIRPYSTRDADKWGISCDIPMAYYESNFTSAPMPQFGDAFTGNQGYWFNYTTTATCAGYRRDGAGRIVGFTFPLSQYSFYIFEAMSRPSTYQAQGTGASLPLRTHFNGQMTSSWFSSTWTWDSARWATSCQGCTFPNVGDRMRLDEAVNIVWTQTYGMGAYPPPELVFIENASLNCLSQSAFTDPGGTCVYGVSEPNAGGLIDRVRMAWSTPAASSTGRMNLFRVPFTHELCHARQQYLGLDPDPNHQGPCFTTPGYDGQAQASLQNADFDFQPSSFDAH